MRLICGLITLDGSDADTACVDAMAASLQQPHAHAQVILWHQGPAAFAVLQFPTATPAEAGAIATTPAGNILAADLRLDDIASLRRSLDTSVTAPDALVALALDRWGHSAPARLFGDFAFARWNPGRRELLLARDTAGVRPLVYHHAPGRHFLFASFPCAIHASGLVPRQLDEAALVHSLYFGFSKTETWSQGVLSLPAGSTLHLHNDRVHVGTYWQPTPQPRRHRSPADAAAELRSLLSEAVESRVGTHGPVAAHLSGGLDSSGLTVLAARALRQQQRKLLAYSFLLRPEERILGDDEFPYVEAVLAQEPDIAWQPVYPRNSSDDLLMDSDRGLAMNEDDPENVVCRYAKQEGASMVLSGWGGDEGATFNGRGMLAHALRHGRWMYLWQEVQAQRRVRGMGLRHLILGQTLAPLLPAWSTLVAEKFLRKGSISARPDVLQPGPLSREQHVPDVLRIGSSLRRTQLALLTSGHISVRTANWASIGARYGLAFTFPMLDRRVQEFALSLPPTWHVRQGWRRRPYRDAMEGILPEALRWRHDKLAPLPQVRGSVRAQRAPLLKQLDDLEKHPRVRAIFNGNALRALLQLIPAEGTGEPAPQAMYAYACVVHTMRYMIYVAQHF